MKRIKWLCVACLLWLPMMFVEAANSDIKPLLALDRVKMIHAQERDGDELYFDISAYWPNQPTQYFRVPAKPYHWSSQAIEKVAQGTLWTAAIKPGQSVVLILSLIESDDSKVNSDDLIGTVRLVLKNENGTLKTHWSVPNRQSEQHDEHQPTQTFDLSGDGGHYEVTFTLGTAQK